MEDEPAAGGGGVQGFVQGLEADAAPSQVGDQGDQVGQGAGEPVEADNDQCVAGAQVVQTGLELGSFSGAAGPLLGEYPQAPDLGQG